MWRALWHCETGIQRKASHLAVLHTQEQKKFLSCFASKEPREPVITIPTKIEFYDVNDWTLVDSLANAASRGAESSPMGGSCDTRGIYRYIKWSQRNQSWTLDEASPEIAAGL